MSTSQEIKVPSAADSPFVLGVIAGGGILPETLVQSCEVQGISIFIVGFEGQTNPELVEGRHHMWARLGAAGRVLKTLKAHDIHDLVLIGSITRPSLSELCPDWRTAQFFAKVGLKALGDDGLLSAMRRELELEGFRLHGVHEYVRELLVPEGLLTRSGPDKEDFIDIERGLEVSQVLGALDVGQSVIVQEGLVLGVEAVEGTDSLIARCGSLRRQGRGGVLVKTCKPQQDTDLDLPTIGPDTVAACARAGLAGIVVHAGRSLLAESQRAIEMADRAGMFILGIDPEAYLRQSQE